MSRPKEKAGTHAGIRNQNTFILPRVLTVREVAQALGLKEGTVRLWTAQRRIPFVRLGRCIRVRVETVNQLIESNTVPARQRWSSKCSEEKIKQLEAALAEAERAVNGPCSPSKSLAVDRALTELEDAKERQ